MSSPNTNLPMPEWIQWGKSQKTLDGKNSFPFYRKMTNLYGGPPGENSLQWVSDMQVTPSGKYSYADSISAFMYNEDPKYVWFQDEASGKLKISEPNNPITWNIDPRSKAGECYDSKKDGFGKCDDMQCCGGVNRTSSLDKCVFKWRRESNASGGKANCGDGGFYYPDGGIVNDSNQFTGPWQATCDVWHYIITGSVFGPGGTSQDISGTFCNKTQNQEEGTMKTVIGCDCGPGVGWVSVAQCGNFHKDSCGTSNVDDNSILKSPNYAAERAYWQFIDEDTAFACCCQDENAIKSGVYPQCKYAFDPVGKNASKCPQITQQYCANNWGENTDIGGKCQAFLINSPSNAVVTQQTIQNYIVSDNRSPQDYISYPLWKMGEKLSKEYYEGKGCTVQNRDYYNCGENRGDADHPCCRDDSTDNFFTETMPYMCNFDFDTDHPNTSDGSMKSVCDGQLRYFCQSFTREHLEADITLQNICGCNLIQTPSDNPLNYNIDGAYDSITQNGQMYLSRCSDNLSITPVCEKPSVSPYYVTANVAGDNCDIICTTSLIQSQTLGGKCTQPICVIDQVTINQINSKGGDTTINQDCPGGKCYIVDLDINEVNSNVGDINITQNCQSCYYTSGDNLLTAQEVDCRTGELIKQPDDGKGASGDLPSWKFLKNITAIGIILIIIVIIVIIFFIASYYNKKYQKKLENLIPSEGIAFGDEYWDS